MVTQYFLKNLNDLMENSNLNQTKLASALGIHQGTVNNWFRRNTVPPMETIDTLSKFFKVEPYYLFMEPGTQGNVTPVKRRDDFKNLLDELAEKCLNPIELESYKQMGPEEYIRVLRSNYETNNLMPVTWCLKLNAELSKYTTLDLLQKVRSNLPESVVKKA